MSEDHYRCDCPGGLTGAVCENGKMRIHSSGNVVCYHVMLERPCCTIFYPDLGSACDCLNQISHAAQPIRSSTQIWVVMRHQYGISALVSQTLFHGETSGGVAQCRLFSQVSPT